MDVETGLPPLVCDAEQDTQMLIFQTPSQSA